MSGSAACGNRHHVHKVQITMAESFGVKGRGKFHEETGVFRDELGVAKDSYVATYAALRLYIDSWRSAGVPFSVRAGKRLARTVTEVVVELKPAPQVVFPEALPSVGGR